MRQLQAEGLGVCVCVCVCRGVGGLVWLHISVSEGRRYWRGQKPSSPYGNRKPGRSLWICLSLLSNTELVVTQHKGRERGKRGRASMGMGVRSRERRENEGQVKG